MNSSSANINMVNMMQIILVMFMWSICFPVITLGIPYAPHITFATMRAFLAGAVLLIPSFLMNRQQPKEIKIWLMLGSIGLGATTFGFFGMFHASEFVSPWVATVIANSQPLMAMILASIVLNEHLDGRGKSGIFLGFVGILVIASPSILSGNDTNYLIGIFYIILAALGITVSNVLIRKIAGQNDALTAMGWQLMFGSFFLAVIAFFTEDITNITWNASFTFSLLVPIFGLTMAAIFFEENITILTVFGVGLIIIGIIIVNLPRQKTMIKDRNS